MFGIISGLSSSSLDISRENSLSDFVAVCGDEITYEVLYFSKPSLF